MDDIIKAIAEKTLESATIVAGTVQAIEDLEFGDTVIESFIYSLVSTLHDRHPGMDMKRLLDMLYEKNIKEAENEKDV